MPPFVPHLAAVLLAGQVTVAPSLAGEKEGWAALNETGTHIVMRHAEAPGTGYPAGFRLGDCATQRNLSGRGREQARNIGAAITGRGIEVDRILTSQWCRASETATLLDLGAVEEVPALNSFFDERDGARGQSDETIRRLTELDARSERVVLVTHQVNVTALTDVFPASGEMIVVRVSGDRLNVLGRIVAD